jgi:hypothetical protein
MLMCCLVTTHLAAAGPAEQNIQTLHLVRWQHYAAQQFYKHSCLSQRQPTWLWQSSVCIMPTSVTGALSGDTTACPLTGEALFLSADRPDRVWPRLWGQCYPCTAPQEVATLLQAQQVGKCTTRCAWVGMSGLGGRTCRPGPCCLQGM